MAETVEAINGTRGNAANSAAQYMATSSHTTTAVENERIDEAAHTSTVQPTAVTRADSAVLSLAAQEKLLQQEGRSIGEIADQLGLTTSAVQIDLQISVASPQAS
jgi:DNA-directed RNA polymerase specialized sigma24 family protein